MSKQNKPTPYDSFVGLQSRPKEARMGAGALPRNGLQGITMKY